MNLKNYDWQVIFGLILLTILLYPIMNSIIYFLNYSKLALILTVSITITWSYFIGFVVGIGWLKKSINEVLE